MFWIAISILFAVAALVTPWLSRVRDWGIGLMAFSGCTMLSIMSLCPWFLSQDQLVLALLALFGAPLILIAAASHIRDSA